LSSLHLLLFLIDVPINRSFKLLTDTFLPLNLLLALVFIASIYSYFILCFLSLCYWKSSYNWMWIDFVPLLGVYFINLLISNYGLKGHSFFNSSFLSLNLMLCLF
jgi:hypothetical protein